MFRIWRRLSASNIKSRIFEMTRKENFVRFFFLPIQRNKGRKYFPPMLQFILPCFFQGRLFSYNDTHRHRLGANFQQIPVNCPYRYKKGLIITAVYLPSIFFGTNDFRFSNVFIIANKILASFKELEFKTTRGMDR